VLVRIDVTSPEPLYAQLARAVAAEIESGAVPAGEALPAAKSLAADLGINVHTVLRAYDALRDRGLVEMRRGRGSVVRGRRPTPVPVRRALRELLAAADASGLSREDLVSLVRES
jgi:GntR family transcriptional regulator